MENIKAIIVEDELRSASALKNMLAKYCPEVNVIAEIRSAEAARKQLPLSNSDLIFFDIELGDGNSFDVLKELPKLQSHLIFTTAFNNFAIRAFKFSAIDYLLKPINIKELMSAVEKAKALINLESQSRKIDLLVSKFSNGNTNRDFEKIALPTLEGLSFVEIKDIVRLAADGSYTHFYFTDKSTVLVSHNLKEYDVLFSNHHFFRVHHSHIINLKHIKKYVKGNGGFVVMSDGSTVDIAQRRKEEFLTALKLI